MKPIIILPRPRNLQAALAYAMNEAQKHNIFFEGNEYTGRGSGQGFAAKYTVHPTCIVTCGVR